MKLISSIFVLDACIYKGKDEGERLTHPRQALGDAQEKICGP